MVSDFFRNSTVASWKFLEALEFGYGAATFAECFAVSCLVIKNEKWTCCKIHGHICQFWLLLAFS